MKKFAYGIIAFCCILLASIFAIAKPLIDVDATSAVAEFISPQAMVIHNMLLGEDLLAGTFEWKGKAWVQTGDLEQEETFAFEDYYPLQVGDTWTYKRSDGSEYTRTVTGTDLVGGELYMRVEDSDGEIRWWKNDDAGWWLGRIQKPDGSHPGFDPLQLANPFLYLGFPKLAPYSDAPLSDVDGNLIGYMTGYMSYMGNSVEDVETLEGTFADCLRTHYIHSWSGTWQENLTGIVSDDIWLAEGIGPVKEVRTWSRISFSINGNIGNVFKGCSTDVMVLQSATVGGITYP